MAVGNEGSPALFDGDQPVSSDAVTGEIEEGVEAQPMIMLESALDLSKLSSATLHTMIIHHRASAVATGAVIGAGEPWKQRSKPVVALAFMQIGIRSKNLLL